MKHESCRHLLDSLSDYVDGSLGEVFCDEIERHIEDCENCRIVVDTLRKTVYLYHQSTAESQNMPQDVRQRLFRRLDLDEFIRTPENG